MAGKYTKAALIGLLERAAWTLLTTLVALVPATAVGFGGVDWQLVINAAALSAGLSAVKSALSILGDGNVSTVDAEVVVPAPPA